MTAPDLEELLARVEALTRDYEIDVNAFGEKLAPQLASRAADFRALLAHVRALHEERAAYRALIDDRTRAAASAYRRGLEAAATITEAGAAELVEGNRTNQIDRHVSDLLRGRAAAIRDLARKQVEVARG